MTYAFSFVNAVSTVIKLIVAVLLVLIGLGAFGALLSLIFSGLGTAFLGLIFVYPFLKTKAKKIDSSRILKAGFEKNKSIFFGSNKIVRVFFKADMQRS